jgi:hypothetical protein
LSAEAVHGLETPEQAVNGTTPQWLRDAGHGAERLTINELCDRFGSVCESAVDPLEVASALEFDGYSDRMIRAEYGVPDVFALARAMYLRVPRKPADPEPSADPWQVSRIRPLLHGLLYALPAVCFPAAIALLEGPGVLPTLVVALLVAWGLSQGLACIGYMRLGTDPGQARRVLRAGLAVGLVLVALAMTATGLATGAHFKVLSFGAGEGVYMLGACVLMVLGAEWWLPAALAPGVLGSAAFLYLGKPLELQHLAWAALAATPLLACAIALMLTRRTAPRAGRLVVAAELRAAVPAIALGVVAAGLLTFPVIVGPEGHGGINPGALLASIPLSLSMGAAEWTLLWYRRRTRRLLRTITTPRAFRLRARLSLLIALLQYVSGTVVLVAAAVVVADRTGLLHPRWAYMPVVVAYIVLGSAMFLALLLQTLRIRAVPLAAAAAALAVEIALRHHGMVVQVAVPVGLFIVIGSYAVAKLGAAVRHG